MANNEKRVREVARCLRTLVKEQDGTSLRVKDVITLIENEDLNDIAALTQRVRQSIADTPRVQEGKGSDRRQAIATFTTENREAISGNPTIQGVLRAAYSLGRYSKEQREELLREFSTLLDSEEATEEYNF